jgi:multidrug resistance protein, MATE family
LVFLLALLGMWVLFKPDLILTWTQIPHEFQDQVRDYLFIVALGLPGALVFRVYGTLNQSIGKPRWLTAIQIIGLIFKVPLSILLVTGWHEWLKPMGLLGCAWASLIVNYLMVTIALFLIKTQEIYAPYRLWKFPEAPDISELIQFLKLGIPSGLAIGVEVTSFTLLSLFIARMGVTATASHQIASNMTALLYMVPLSFSIATTARVSYWLGAENKKMARSALLSGFKMVLIIACSLSGLLQLLNTEVAHFYTHSIEIATLASVLLSWVSLYHLADSLQVFCVFTLRSYRITLLPLMIYTFCLWGIGLGGGYWIAYASQPVHEWFQPNSPITFWQTSTIALWLTAIILVGVLYAKMRQSLNTPSINRENE